MIKGGRRKIFNDERKYWIIIFCAKLGVSVKMIKVLNNLNLFFKNFSIIGKNDNKKSNGIEVKRGELINIYSISESFLYQERDDWENPWGGSREREQGYPLRITLKLS